MLSDWLGGGQAQALLAWFHAVLGGMAAPWVIALVLAGTTLLLEDLAIAAGAALATQGMITWGLAFIAVGGGIAAGDLGLYVLGFAAARAPWLRRRAIGERSAAWRDRLARRLGPAVLVARVVPGLRFVTYTASGFLRVPFIAFSGWVVLAVSLWTAGLFVVSAAIGRQLAQQLGLPAPLAVALPIVLMALLVPLWRWAVARRNGHGLTRPASSQPCSAAAVDRAVLPSAKAVR